MRHGFTLIETLVALILLEIGMLALLATSATAARDLAIAHRAVRAQSLARNRLELLWAGACAQPSTGHAVGYHGFIESWSVEAAGSQRAISAAVSFALPGGKSRVVTLRAATVCP
jgi:Tfp pilus assembly protein PilV